MKIVTIVTLISQGTNALLDYILMAPEIGLNMGMKGAAIATSVGQSLMYILPLILIQIKYKQFKLEKKYYKTSSDEIKSIVKFGMPQFIQQFTMALTMGITTMIIANIGQNELVAYYSAAGSILMFVFMPSFGLRQGTMPLLGYEFGKKNYKNI